MKIAYIALKDMPFGGGIEKYTEEIATRLAQRGHEIIVYTSGKVSQHSHAFKIKNIPSLKFRSLEKLSASFMAAVHQNIRHKIDIVHFHAFGPAMFSFIPRLIDG